MEVEKGAQLTRPAVSGDTSVVVAWRWAMSACRVGLCRQADAFESAGRVGTGQRADLDPVGRPTPFLSACRLPKASPPRVPREPDDRSQKVARAIYRLRRTDRTSRQQSIDRPPNTRCNDSVPPDITTHTKSIERPIPCRYIDMRQRCRRWRKKRQATPRWAGADQSIDTRCSMDRNALLNGWTRVRQWIPRCDSMDRAARLNGSNETRQWIDKHRPIWRGKTDRERDGPKGRIGDSTHGYGSAARWLSLPRTDNHPYERPMVIPHEDSRLWDRRPTVIPSADP